MEHQDWDPIRVGTTLKKKPAPRPAHSAGTKALHAVEDDEHPKLPTKSLSAASRAEIIRLRNTAEPKKTQAELNTLCAFPVNTINKIESGHLCPTPKQLEVLNRVLRTTLKYA